MEGVGVTLEEAQVGVHARPGVLAERLGHERRPDALLEGDLLDDGAEGHDVVGRRECVGIAQVDLVLPGRALVMAELHRDAHVLQQRDRGPAKVVGGAVWDVVEVAAVVDRHGSDPLALRRVQQEELDLGVGVEGEPQVGGPAQGPAQDVARVGETGLPVRGEQVAEHSRGARVLPAPRQHLEGRRVGLDEHVGLIDAGEALDGRAVEADPLGERTLKLGGRNRHRLQRPDDVGEPQPDEPDVALFNRAQDKLLLTVHVTILPHRCYRRVSGPDFGQSRVSSG